MSTTTLRTSAADLGKMTQARMLGGKSAPIALDGARISIDGARVTAADIASSNGWLHGIDKVNIPTRH